MPQGRRGHTLEYAAPELLAGEARSPTTDVWAAAVLLYELLCNEMPEEEIAARIAAGAFPDPLTRRPYLPRRFRSFFRGVLEPDPAERAITTAESMKRALADIPIRCEWFRFGIPLRSRYGRGSR